MPVIYTIRSITQGIVRHDNATIDEPNGRGGSRRVARVVVDGKRVTYLNQEWHLTRAAAAWRAQELLEQEIATTERRLAALKTMRFK